MTLPSLHFVHGNSFPAGTYSAMLKHLREHYRVDALAMHAHDPQFPVTDGWHELVQELIVTLTSRYTEPVILLGHSMGGMLSLMAARARPDLIRCVVLLDAPVVAGWRAQIWRYVKHRGIGDKYSPARFSANRRHVWPDAEAAFQHYVAKPMFAIWPTQVLRDYLEHGLVSHKDGVTLRFDRDIETAVYRTLPHHIGSLARRPFPVPVGFIGGEDSVECRQAGLGATRTLVGDYFCKIPGGHLFPMETPDVAAREVHAMIERLLTTD